MSHVGPRPLSAGDGFGWNAAPEVTDYEVKSALTGRKVARDTFIDGQVRARLLRVESDDIVERMERCGIRGRSARGAVSVVGMVSGQAETASGNSVSWGQIAFLNEILSSLAKRGGGRPARQ